VKEEAKADRYADSPLGSEILSTCLTVHTFLERQGVRLSHRLQKMIAPLLDLAKDDHIPIVLEANHLPLAILKSETGGAPAIQLATLQQLIDQHVQQVTEQQEIRRKAKDGDEEALIRVIREDIRREEPDAGIIIQTFGQRCNFELQEPIPWSSLLVPELKGKVTAL